MRMKVGNVVAGLGIASMFILLSPRVSQAALIAVEDNFVRKSLGLQGTGDEATFELKEATTAQSNARIAYLKFDLTTITESILNQGVFTVTSTSSATANYTLKAFALNTGASGYDWTENAITYANRPAYNNSTNPLIDPSLATAVGSEISVSSLNSNTAAGSKYSFTFANLENYRQLDDTITFILLITTQSNSTPSFLFASSENGTLANRPSLEVAAIPEPTTFGLLGCAILSGLIWRRRLKSSN